MTPADDFIVAAVGDAALLVRFEARIDPIVNGRALQLAHRLGVACLAGVRDIVPAFRSVTVHYDPVRTDLRTLRDRVVGEAREAQASVQGDDVQPKRIPVCYGGPFGPDLAAVAEWAGLSEEQVVTAHRQVKYRVYMLGFLPGFAYLGVVDPRIAMPRKASPRVRVPAGSVAIAGSQTGIYPLESPGGWNVIGRTPMRLFDAGQPAPSVLEPGDYVQFTPIEPTSFDVWDGARMEAST